MTQDREPVRFIYRTPGHYEELWGGTWDIETAGLGGEFLGGVTYTMNGETGVMETRTWDSLAEMFAYMLDPPRPYVNWHKRVRQQRKMKWRWYAHNGARYDFVYLAKLIADHAVAQGITVDTVQQGRKVIALNIPTEKGKVQLADSLPSLFCSLEQAAKVYAPDRPKMAHCPDHDFTKDEAVHWNPGCEYCVSYMIRDAVTLFEVMGAFRDKIYSTFKVTPGLTTGSTAMKAFMAQIEKGKVYYRQNPKKEAFLRNFGCGSITYPGAHSDVWLPEPGEEVAALTFDRSAAFAACMAEGGYPTTAGVWTREEYETDLGFYEVKVTTTPAVTFPFIPITTKEGRKFAQGKGMTAYVTSEMMKMGREAGYIIEVVRGLVFERTEDVFGSFIQLCEDLEYPPDGSDADPAVRSMAKNMRNSLNGKFNMKAEMERLYIGEPVDEEGNLIDGAHVVIDPDTGEQLPLFSVTETADGAYLNPHWYALTTSRQIMEIARLMVLLEPGQRGKVDTDSFTGPKAAMETLAASGAVDLGRGYGAWKVEHEWRWLQSLGVKNYMGDDQDGPVDYCKGIPRSVMKVNRAAHIRAAAGEKVQLSFPSLRSTQEMIALGLYVPGVQRLRSIGIPENAAGWEWDPATHHFSPVFIEPESSG